MWRPIHDALARTLSGERAVNQACEQNRIERWFTFPNFERSAERCGDELRRAGLDDVEVESFPADGETMWSGWGRMMAWDVESARLWMIEPRAELLADWSVKPQSLVMYSGACEVEAEVVEWNGELDADLTGKIPFTRHRINDVYPQMRQLGAGGIVSDFIGTLPGVRDRFDLPEDVRWENSAIRMGHGDQWGFMLTPRQGRMLRDLLHEGPVRLRAEVRSRNYPGIFKSATGVIRGAEEPGQEVLFVTHLYEPGANDNASGAGCGLEIARALTAERAAKESELSDKGILRADLQSRADDTASRLVPYLDLDQRLAASRHERAAHEAAHQGFLENSKVAGLLASRRERAAKIESDLRVAQGEHEGIAARLAETAGLYDAEEYAAVRRRETQLRAEQARLNGQMEVQRQNLQTTEAEIKTLRKAASDLQRVRGELAEARTLHGLVARTRGWLREAGPMVTQLLVDSISHRAANLFSEIMNDYRQRLRWGSDYGIVLEVQGRERSFGQLSGGEQMSASLAVRLAVLGELFGGIDIAFFDEPTANLDENRRSNLADQIMAVKGFSQIFVISHDDTFERATGHFIRVIKENGESHIASE